MNKKDRELIKDFREEIRLLHAGLVPEFRDYICACFQLGFRYHVSTRKHDPRKHPKRFYYILVVKTDFLPVDDNLPEVALYKPTGGDFPAQVDTLNWNDPLFFDKIKSHLRKYIKPKRRSK